MSLATLEVHMSLATLDDFKDDLKPDQKLKIKVGTYFKLLEYDHKKHAYWGLFFKKYVGKGKTISYKELLEYPHMNGTDWRYINDNKTIIQHFEFGLVEVTNKKTNEKDFHVLEFFTAELV